MKTYVVQLEDHDDVISAGDKITWSKARRVLLIWPRAGRVLERQVDLLLLQRRCQALGAQFAVVTNSGAVRANARALGISVFASAEQAQRANWRVSRATQAGGRTALWQGRKPLPAQALREQRGGFHALPARDRRLDVAIFTLAVFSFLALALFFLPGATVTLAPAEEDQQISLPVWARPEIQVANPSGGLPARSVTVIVEGRDQKESTGLIQTPDGTATGLVQLTNLTDSEVEVPQGSIVLADALQFSTTRKVLVPAGLGQAQSVPVRALLPGSAGNVAAGAIRAMQGGKGLLVVVENPQALTGGSDRSSPAPSPRDEQTLRASLLASLEKIALEEVQAMLEPGQILIDGSLRLESTVEETREPAQGQPADVLQLTLRAEYAAWYVEEADVQAVARAALDANLREGYRDMPETFAFALSMQPPEAQQADEVNFQGQLEARRRVQADWSESQTIEAITGRSLADAAEILRARLELASAPEIELFPTWWRRLPYLPARIVLVQP